MTRKSDKCTQDQRFRIVLKYVWMQHAKILWFSQGTPTKFIAEFFNFTYNWHSILANSRVHKLQAVCLTAYKPIALPWGASPARHPHDFSDNTERSDGDDIFQLLPTSSVHFFSVWFYFVNSHPFHYAHYFLPKIFYLLWINQCQNYAAISFTMCTV